MRLNTVLPSTTIIGAGGIGSSAMLALAKMGLQNITIYDDDVLEEHNVGNQFLPAYVDGQNQYGILKVHALQRLINSMLPPHACATMHYIPEKWPTASVANDGRLVVVTVDSMAMRKAAFELLLNEGENTDWYLDLRMGAQQLRIYLVNLTSDQQIEDYQATLYSDDDAEPLPCTERGIVYTSMFAGAHAANLVRQLVFTPESVPFRLGHQIEFHMIGK